MGSFLSLQWKTWLTEYCSSLGLYLLIFSKCFINAKNQQKNSIQNAVDLATNVISQINAVICILCGFTIFYYKLWNDNVVQNIGLRVPFHNQALLLSYLSADIIGLMSVHIKYQKNTKIKWDIIIHHIFGIIPFCLWEIPQPKYYWVLLSQYPGIIEISTIFLNNIWFGKYFKLSKNFRRISKFGFVLTWFTVRLPAIFLLLIYTIYKWKQIKKEYPNRIKYSIIIMWILMGTLQLVWTVAIIYKIVGYFEFKTTVSQLENVHVMATETVHGQTLQLSSQTQKT
eukprot:286758_1